VTRESIDLVDCFVDAKLVVEAAARLAGEKAHFAEV